MTQLLILEKDETSSSESPFVPVLDGHEAASQDATLLSALQQFEQAYPQQAPQWVARAPGRVNLIGEHIDYNGFGVLPMALHQSVFCVGSSSATTGPTATAGGTNNNHNSLILHIQSTSPGADPRQYTFQNIDQIMETFAAAKEEEDTPPPFDATDRDWSHYVLCAFFGVLEHMATHQTALPKHFTLHFYLLVHGTVPQGAGVSSSSALVVSSALTFLALLEQPVPKTDLAKLCARCERWVGTEGGGMDQAISIFAEAGSSRYIQFQPTVQHQAIPLPTKLASSWVVCHSLQESHKRAAAATLFNKRVVECQIAGRYLGQLVGLDPPIPSLLWELVRQSDQSLEELATLARDLLPETISKPKLIWLLLGDDVPEEASDDEQLQQVAAELGITRPAGLQVLKQAQSFCLRDRLLHVLTETRRVQAFVDLCINNQGDDPSNQLGALMNQSHQSCSKLYDCSSPQVDQLQQVCLQAPGAVGARLTGAGWGGCVISLVYTSEMEAFCRHVRQQYYSQLPSGLITSDKKESEYMFVTKPSQGSNLYDFSERN